MVPTAFLDDFVVVMHMTTVLLHRVGHLIRNGKTGPGRISYLRMCASHTKFSITTPEFLIFLQIVAYLPIARFLLTNTCPGRTVP